jgi:hypothetical protein
MGLGEGHARAVPRCIAAERISPANLTATIRIIASGSIMHNVARSNRPDAVDMRTGLVTEVAHLPQCFHFDGSGRVAPVLGADIADFLPVGANAAALAPATVGVSEGIGLTAFTRLPCRVQV